METNTHVTSWQDRLQHIVDTMREMSLHGDPQEMVRSYGARMRKLRPDNTILAISRRGLESPWYRITRSSKLDPTINPWKQPEKLPLLQGGILGELIYAAQPKIIQNFHLNQDDPAFEFLNNHRSLIAIPHYDLGEAVNMVIVLRQTADAFDPDEFPDQVLISNLFGRATHNLVLREQVQHSFDAIDRELKAVAAIQRSLLPKELPQVPGLDLAAYYQTSARAGGDYYDFFHLPGDLRGILIADVSGHGTPAAVLMAVTHSIAHSYPGPAKPPAQLLAYLNQRLVEVYTSQVDAFVTAFYGVYDPANRRIQYASAGHPAPRLKRCSDNTLMTLDGERALPLGIFPDTTYQNHEVQLIPGDQMVFYTDGITEAHNHAGQMFGTDRLDAVLSNCGISAQGLLDDVVSSVNQFTLGQNAEDDRTIVVMKVR